MKSEKRIEQEVMLSLSKEGLRVWKNAVGMAYTKDGSPLRYGLGNGSSDLIGITPKTITQDMVGQTIGVFTAIEMKRSRTGYGATEQQKNFIDTIKKLGGIAGVAYDVESAIDLVK